LIFFDNRVGAECAFKNPSGAIVDNVGDSIKGEITCFEKSSLKLAAFNISKSFPVGGGRIFTLQNINLMIENGAFVSLIGPSGCGKTTLLNIIAGFEKPDSGEIRTYHGEQDRERIAKHILVFQESSLFPWLNVYQNIAYGLKLRNKSKEYCRERVEKYLSLVQLEHFKDAYIHQLSGGMKQRVALARALILEPEVLLMDEPFAALDIQTRQEMHLLLLKIWEKTAKTILFVTHNVEEALGLSGRVVLMSARPGRIKKEYVVQCAFPRQMESSLLREIREEIIREFSADISKNTLGQGGPGYAALY